MMVKLFKNGEIAKEAIEAVSKELLDIVKNQENEFTVIASTESRDRDGESIKLEGWNIENFMKNPVILANHSYRIENIVGKAFSVTNDGNQLVVRGYFANSPLGEIAKQLYNDGMLKTVSVGFIPLERDDVDPSIITKAELLELSFVPVPCNPEAVSLDGKQVKKGLEVGLIKEDKSDDQEPTDEPNDTDKKDNQEKTLENVEKSIKKELKETNDKLDKIIGLLSDGKDMTDKEKDAKEFVQSFNRASAKFLENFKK